MKVLGCKVSDETYQLFNSLDGPISDHLRKAIYQYLQQYKITSNGQVNQSDTSVNQFEQGNATHNNDEIKPKETHTYRNLERKRKPIQNNLDQQKQAQTSDITSNHSPLLLKNRSNSLLSEYKKYEQQRLSFSPLKTNHEKSKQSTIIQCPQCKKYITLNEKTHSYTYLRCPFCNWRIRL